MKIESHLNAIMKTVAKNFLRKSILNQRMKRHLGLKPFKCHYNQCDKSFGRKDGRNYISNEFTIN